MNGHQPIFIWLPWQQNIPNLTHLDIVQKTPYGQFVELAQIFKGRPSGRKIVPSTLLFCTQKVMMVAMVTKEN